MSDRLRVQTPDLLPGDVLVNAIRPGGEIVARVTRASGEAERFHPFLWAVRVDTKFAGPQVMFVAKEAWHDVLRPPRGS